MAQLITIDKKSHMPRKSEGGREKQSLAIYLFSDVYCIYQLTSDFGDKAPSKTTVYHCFTEFNRGRSMPTDEFKEGRPLNRESYTVRVLGRDKSYVLALCAIEGYILDSMESRVKVTVCDVTAVVTSSVQRTPVTVMGARAGNQRSERDMNAKRENAIRIGKQHVWITIVLLPQLTKPNLHSLILFKTEWGRLKSYTKNI
ncbi:hypothetical protein EVAR_92479_1 [Eumeta japonica]|uniref:Uncharacterized protein n=1 Tax=Eumeta variegata TaxID=151549 RepID=A0A4C1T733_EUMVA|nr:hypothetical protein EVAR_92479_1 [Eumeta japonica]